MKYLFSLLFLALLANLGSAQDANSHKAFFEAPWHFHNDFGYKLIIAKGHFGLIDSNGVVVCKPAFDQINDFKANYAVVHLNGKEGIINKWGELIVPPKYDKIQDYRNNWALARMNRKTYYLDTNGNETQGPQPNFHDFKHGPKKKVGNDVVRYVNAAGEVVIDKEYTRGDFFINGNTIVRKDKKQYLIDTTGRHLQEFDYDLVMLIRGGQYVQVWNDKKKGILDRSGNALIPCEYDELEISEDGIIKVKKDFKWGAYNWDFDMIIPTIYDRIDYADYYKVSRNKKVRVTDGQHVGLIDFDGKIIKECIYDQIIIHDDLTMISVIRTWTDPALAADLELLRNVDYTEYLKQTEKINGYEVSDKNGVPLLDRNYYFAKQVHENYFMVGDLVGNPTPNQSPWAHLEQGRAIIPYYLNASLINIETGEVIFENYSDYSYVKDNIFACRDTNTIRCIAQKDMTHVFDNGKRNTLEMPPLDVREINMERTIDMHLWKLLDTSGNEVSIAKKFLITDAGPYGLKVCRKALGKNAYLFGMLDFDGKVVISLKYDDVSHYYGSSFRVKKDNLYGIANVVSKTAGPCKYDHISNELRLSGLFYVEAKRKVGYIDALGNEMIPCIYTSRRDDFRNGRAYFTRDRHSVYLNKNGRELD